MKHARLLLTCMLWVVIATALKAQNTVAAGEFYLMNVGTGLYLKFGGAENAKAAEGHAGTAVTLAKSGNGYTIKTNAGYLDGDLKMTGASTAWTFELVDEANKYYRIKCNSKYLASKSDAYGLLGLVAGNSESSKEKWMLVKKADFFTLFDMTPLIQAASFDTNDNVTNAWNISSDDISKAYEGTDAEEYYLKIENKATTITQNLGKAQVGNYVLSFEAHYTGEGDAPKVRLQLGNKNKDHAEITLSKNDNWESYTGSIGVNGNVKGDIVITITTSASTTLFLDNFELVYKEGKKQQIDNVEEEAQHKYDERALAEIDNIRAYIAEYYPAGLNFFDQAISTLKTNLESEEVTINTESEYRNYLAQINQIKENAKQEHREFSKEDDTNNAIFNPGFELGNLNAWTTEGKIINREEFTAPGIGTYIFLGKNISQEVSNLPTGKYTLTAKVASTNGANVTLTATHGTQTLESNLQQVSNEMSEIKIDNIIIYNGSLLIQVSGDQEFYADDFTLTFVELILHEASTKMFKPTEDQYASIHMTRTIKAGTWNTFVVPFDMAIPTGWEVKELSESTYDEVNDHISLTFGNAENGIKAGVPYMVRVSEAVSEITVENKQLSTTLNNTTTDHVEFVGTYTSGNVPAGAFFISNNVFYQAADGTNTIKAFRAYFTTNTGTYARSLTYRTDGETGITTEENSEEVTVVAIYNMQGVRLDDMQKGINILQMSNGSIIKVMIK